MRGAVIVMLRSRVLWKVHSKDHAVTASSSTTTSAPALHHYQGLHWRDACAELEITHKRTRPYRPQTNGKIERFHRTLGDGWAYARHYTSTQERDDALPDWLHFYNHHRAHSALGGRPPVTRLTNLPGHHN
jgi:transposase InsO family protein